LIYIPVFFLFLVPSKEKILAESGLTDVEINDIDLGNGVSHVFY